MTTAKKKTTAPAANRATRRSTAKTPKPGARTARSIRGVENEAGPQATAERGRLTLSELEAESASEVAPFELDLEDGEDPILIGNPADLDYSLLASGDYDAILANAMSDEDWARFIGLGFTGRQAAHVVIAWREYYALGDQGE